MPRLRSTSQLREKIFKNLQLNTGRRDTLIGIDLQMIEIHQRKERGWHVGDLPRRKQLRINGVVAHAAKDGVPTISFVPSNSS